MGTSQTMRRTSAALLAAIALATAAAGCGGRNENEGGSPDGQGESIEERKQDTGPTTTE